MRLHLALARTVPQATHFVFALAEPGWSYRGDVGRKEAQSMIVRNRAATFHYEITGKFEAGIVLKGTR